jgi:hypothetical protein
VIRGQDVVVLVKLHLVGAADWTVRSLADDLGYDLAGVSRSLWRLATAGLFDPERRRPRAAQSEEFLIHAVKYVFPATLGAPSRGMPTAWAVPPLSEAIAAGDEPPPVWPHRGGEVRGFAVKPVHRLAVDASMRDPGMREWLALLDALRVGEARERRLAADHLRDRVRSAAHAGAAG